MFTVRSIHTDYDRNGVPVSCAVLKVNNCAWQHHMTSRIPRGIIGAGPLSLQIMSFFFFLEDFYVKDTTQRA